MTTEEERRVKAIDEILERNRCQVCRAKDPTTFLTSGTDRICTSCVKRRHRIAVGRGSKRDHELEKKYDKRMYA